MSDVKSQLFQYLAERHQPQNVNLKHRETFKFQDKIALVLTTAVGTMYAVYFFTVATAGWMLWQTKLTNQPFDPYPFAFLLFIGSLLQLPLMSLIMVAQNLQGKHAEIRAEEEFHTTNSTYKDIEKILTHLDKQDQELLKQTKMLTELVQKLPKK